MSKREGESVHGGNPTFKKRKSVKARAILIADSDEENPPPNASADYARWVRTRVTSSGQVGSVTTSSVPLADVADITDEPPLEVGTVDARDMDPQGVVPKIQKVQRKRKKANDSVSLITHLRSPFLTHNCSDKDAVVA